MGLRTRILRVVEIENGGPRNKNVLKSLARTPVQAEQFDELFEGLLAIGALVKYDGNGRSESVRRHALYGPPGLRRQRGGGWTRVH